MSKEKKSIKNETIIPSLYEISDLLNENQEIIISTNSEDNDEDKEDISLDFGNDEQDEDNDEPNVEDIENQTNILGLLNTEEHLTEALGSENESESGQCTFFIVFECGICAEQFTSKSDQKDHMLDEHKATSCPKCDEFFELDIFDDHLASHTNNEEHNQNDLIIEDAIRLDIIDELDTENIIIDETKTAEETSSNDILTANFKCNKCNALFAKERSLRIHYNSNKCTEQSHECNICKKVFARKRNLLQHMLLHQDKKYKCSDCDKQFSRQDRYNVHIQDHQGIKKHRCPYCAKGFNIISALKDHVRVHNGEKPYL